MKWIRVDMHGGGGGAFTSSAFDQHSSELRQRRGGEVV